MYNTRNMAKIRERLLNGVNPSHSHTTNDSIASRRYATYISYPSNICTRRTNLAGNNEHENAVVYISCDRNIIPLRPFRAHVESAPSASSPITLLAADLGVCFSTHRLRSKSQLHTHPMVGDEDHSPALPTGFLLTVPFPPPKFIGLGPVIFLAPPLISTALAVCGCASGSGE